MIVRFSQVGIDDQEVIDSLIQNPQFIYRIGNSLLRLVECDAYTKENQEYILADPKNATDTSLDIIEKNRLFLNEASLNGTQRNILEGTFQFILDDISDNLPDLFYLDQAFFDITRETVYCRNVDQYIKAGIWESIQQARAIMLHPCPQNRSESYPYFVQPKDPDYIVYKDASGRPAIERRGLLGLTARNDDTARPVTKDAIVHYVGKLLKEKREEAREKFIKKRDAARTIQSYFRMWQEKRAAAASIPSGELSIQRYNSQRL